MRQHRFDHRIRGAELFQVNDLLGVQVKQIPGGIDVGDNGVVGDFGLGEFGDFTGRIVQVYGRRSRDLGRAVLRQRGGNSQADGEGQGGEFEGSWSFHKFRNQTFPEI